MTKFLKAAVIIIGITIVALSFILYNKCAARGYVYSRDAVNFLKTEINRTIDFLMSTSYLNESPYQKIEHIVDSVRGMNYSRETMKYFNESLRKAMGNASTIVADIVYGTFVRASNDFFFPHLPSKQANFSQVRKVVDSVDRPLSFRVTCRHSTSDFDYLYRLFGKEKAYAREDYYYNGEYLSVFGLVNATINLNVSPVTLSGKVIAYPNRTVFLNKTRVLIYERECYHLALINHTYLYGVLLFDRGKCRKEFMDNFYPLVCSLAYVLQNLE